MHVYTKASTIFSGGTPKAGLYAEATGTGSMSTSVTAGYVALSASAPSSVTTTGTALAATSYGFTQTAAVSSSSSSIPIVMNASTVVGGAPLATGAIVKVTGLGSTSTSVLATSIVVSTPTPPPGTVATPTPGPIAQKHLVTEDYLGPPDGTTSIAWSAAAPYLNWAQTDWQNANAVSAAGIKTQLYVDPNRSTATGGDPFYSTDETTFAHDCSGNRVTDLYSGTVTQYVMNIGSASLVTTFVNYVNEWTGSNHFDALYMDDAGALSEEATYSPFSAMPCGYTD